jgi:predicted porin
MKELHIGKTLFALAAIAAGGSAAAQSSLSMFGILDATLAWGRGSGPGSAHKFQVTNSGFSGSRLGFRGAEDLGGGLSASFWLEGAVFVDNGSGSATNTNNQAAGGVAAPSQGLTFNRRSTVSLAGNWGEIRIGRDYDPQYLNLAAFDPTGTNGVGANVVFNAIITGATANRVSNGINYLLPANLGGFYGIATYYVGENPSNAGATHGDGTGYAARLGYQRGPLNVAVAAGYTRYAAGGVHQNNIGAQWDFKVVNVMGEYESDSNGSTRAKGGLVGALIPVGSGEVRVSYSRYSVDSVAGADPRYSKWVLGYNYIMSKRTNIYTTYARAGNSNGAALGLDGAITAPNHATTGLEIGIRHVF